MDIVPYNFFLLKSLVKGCAKIVIPYFIISFDIISKPIALLFFSILLALDISASEILKSSSLKKNVSLNL